jgi:hypothetical protein
MYQSHLEGLEVRCNLVLRAPLTFFYLSLGAFAAAALISILGSVFSISAPQIGLTAIALLAPLSGTVGVAGLVVGVHDDVQINAFSCQKS